MYCTLFTYTKSWAQVHPGHLHLFLLYQDFQSILLISYCIPIIGYCRMYNNLSITHFESRFRDQTKGFLVCIINICNVVYYSKQFWEQFWAISTHLCQEHSLPHDFLFMKGFKVVVYLLCNKHTKILMCTTFKTPIRVVFGSCDCLYKFWKVSPKSQTSGKLRRSVA